MALGMNQRKEKLDRASQSNQEAILNLLPLLEGSDYEQIKNLIQENLCETKDPRLLFGIVDYYMIAQSQRALSILLRLKEPHDKNLFDKLSELMKIESYRYKSLQLLCNIVYQQPSWLYKIASHRIMHTLLNLLKADTNSPNLMSGLLILVCLLPMIPCQFGPFLTDTFEIFSRIAEWNVKKPSFIVDIDMIHLDVVIYSLFHRLYGMFPCNFLAYLRSYYGGRDCTEDNFKVFTSVIKPMLERVRLHPLLVTASKETELSTNRWKKMAYHDIIVDCASISLDAIEGTRESMRRKNNVISSSFEQNVCSYESNQFISYSSQSSSSVNFEPESLTNDIGISLEQTWTPSSALSMPISGSSNPTSPLLLKSDQELRSYSTQLSTEEIAPLDFAIEAKPEVLKMEMDNSNAQASSTKGSKNIFIASSPGIKDIEKNQNIANDFILPAVEAKEDDIDKEVSELTSTQKLLTDVSLEEARLDTPFCSTTQNLTDEPGDLPLTVMLNSERSDSITKSNDDGEEEMFNSLQENDMESFVQPFNRYRYFSHCGPPPVIPTECIKKPKVLRSASCPAKLCPSDQNVSTIINFDGKTVLSSDSVVVTCSNSAITTSSAFVPVPSENAIASSGRLITYQELIPVALNPLADIRQHAASFGANFPPQVLYLNTLSPPELLDRHIQFGSTACTNYLRSIPITSTKNTDWTHFGGKPPPDEVTILRNQILLLHNQLLFERHRKDVHSERNRRILGRAKRFRMQEEHIIALKEQIKLLEQDKTDLKVQLEKKRKLHNQLLAEKQQVENDLLSRIAKAEQDNSQLSFCNKKFQNLLVSQKQENDEIREICKRNQTEIRTLKQEIEYASEEAFRCQKLEKENVFLTKQMVLMQELINHYKDKMELMKESQQPDIGAEILNEATCFEIKDLKQKLETKSSLVDTMKTKIADLEQLLSNMKANQKKQKQAFDRMQSLHKDEITVREERLKDLRKISAQKDAHILKLHQDIDNLLKEKSILRQQINGEVNSVDQTSIAAQKFPQNTSNCHTKLSSSRELHQLESKSQIDEDIS